MSYRPPLKGKRLTTFCALLALPHPLLSLTHWIFRSLMLPYKSSSLVQNVFAVHRFARGGRRLAVRTAMEHPTGALPRTPFPASRDFPSRGNERYEGKNRESYISCTIPQFPPLVASAASQSAELFSCHMIQKSKSRNADFILIAREGDTTTLGAKGPVKLKNPPARKGRSILRTFSL